MWLPGRKFYFALGVALVCLGFECVRNQTDLVRATTHKERAAIMARPGPIGATKTRRQLH